MMTLGIACLVISAMAQSIKGPSSISYFQAPSKGVEFATADVFISNDEVLSTAKKEAQQAKNAAFGSKFGALGESVAGAVNDGMDAAEKFNKMLDAYKDDKGCFAYWDFVPAYILTNAETKKNVKVEIFILTEPNPSPSARMPTTADSDGYYDIPYYVNCRYKVSDNSGKELLEENMGVLEGKQKTKNYTPQTASAGNFSSLGKSVAEETKVAATDLAEGNLEDEVPIQDRIGTNIAYNAVRTAVFARYGFGQFNAPIKLGVVKESKNSKKMIKPTLAVFSDKKGLLLNNEEKKTVQAFAKEMVKVLPATTEKTKWVALHNLSVCYAWLEDADKASTYYKQYGEEIKTTLEKVECWNAILAGTMKSKEMKEKVGSTFIGTRELKQYQQYNNVNNFVNFYPAGAQRYQALLFTINRDLKRFVDLYSVNDLLCQLFEIDYPFQFFPLQDCKGAPKDMRAVVQKEGMEPVEYRVKYDSKRRIKELQADQITLLADGNKEKLITRDIMPKYTENGKYSHLETDAGVWAQAADYNNSYYNKLNYVHDPILKNTYGKANNITKKAGFLGGKESEETVQLKVDLEGNIYFTGSSKYFKANAFYKEVLNAAGVVPKRVDTKTTFTTKANINEQGIMTNWLWEGNSKTNLATGASMREEWMSAEPMVRGIKFVDVDDKGNPTKIEFEFQLQGSMAIEEKAKGMAFVNKYLVDLNGPKPTVSKDNFNFSAKNTWDCSFEYDAAGNWTKMKIGPYSAERTFKY